MTRPARDEMANRANMEASENTRRAPESGAASGLHRIDPDRVTETFGSDRQAAGYERLELMLTAVIPKLVGESGTRKPA
jgi:hypothetical protein